MISKGSSVLCLVQEHCLTANGQKHKYVCPNSLQQNPLPTLVTSYPRLFSICPAYTRQNSYNIHGMQTTSTCPFQQPCHTRIPLTKGYESTRRQHSQTCAHNFGHLCIIETMDSFLLLSSAVICKMRFVFDIFCCEI